MKTTGLQLMAPMVYIILSCYTDTCNIKTLPFGADTYFDIIGTRCTTPPTILVE